MIVLYEVLRMSYLWTKTKEKGKGNLPSLNECSTELRLEKGS